MKFLKRMMGSRRTLTDNLGRTLLAVWLIATGAVPLLGLSGILVSTLLPILAVAAGICLLLGR